MHLLGVTAAAVAGAGAFFALSGGGTTPPTARELQQSPHDQEGDRNSFIGELIRQDGQTYALVDRLHTVRHGVTGDGDRTRVAPALGRIRGWSREELSPLPTVTAGQDRLVVKAHDVHETGLLDPGGRAASRRSGGLLLADMDLAGGATYDALVALAARDHAATLATLDARARSTSGRVRKFVGGQVQALGSLR